MANPEHVAILKRGVGAWNKWRRSLYRRGDDARPPDLSGLDLFGAHLNDIDLTRVDLRKCDLRSAMLIGADFRGACIERTRFAGASLLAAHFGPMVLLTRSGTITCYGPAFGEAFTLSGPNVADARFGFTTIDSVDLRKWSGLEIVKHDAPSLLTFRTLLNSQGEVPLVFLRGCGLSEALINYLPSLSREVIQSYSCFISYSTKDQEFADRLHADLQHQGVRCWFAPHDVRGGRKLHEQIDEAIHLYDRLLLILSEHSMNSEWVKTEIAHARQKELNEKRQVLFPIRVVPFAKIRDWKCFDADTGKDSAREIREYFIPNFSNWKDHDSYQRAFQRLVRDFEAEGRRERTTERP